MSLKLKINESAISENLFTDLYTECLKQIQMLYV